MAAMTPVELIDRMEQALKAHPPAGVSADDIDRIVSRHRKALVETARELLAVREVRLGDAGYNEFTALEVETNELGMDPDRDAFVAAMTAATRSGKARVLRLNAAALRYLRHAVDNAIGPEGIVTGHLQEAQARLRRHPDDPDDQEEVAEVRAIIKDIRDAASAAGVPVPAVRGR